MGHKPQDNIAAQIEIANHLYEADKQQNQTVQERLAATQAAEAMGIPAHYMEQAAAELAAREAALARRRKRRQFAGVLGAAVVIGASGTWGLTHRTHRQYVPPPPLVYNFIGPASEQWQLGSYNGNSPTANPHREHPEGLASVTFPSEQGHQVAMVKVWHFDQHNPNYYVDLDTNQVPRSLTGYRTVSFRVRGVGLSQIRLFLWNGNERWCSPFLPAAGYWHTVRVPLNQFLHQMTPPRYNPVDAPYKAPAAIGMISFKVGEEANSQDAHGEIAIDDLRFE